MNKKLLLFLSCLVMSIGFVSAQTTKASGTVVDETGEPVIGATVVLKGTAVGTVTDLDGKFEFNLPSGKSTGTLVFSFIGSKTIEMASSNDMQVVLEADSKLLREVEIQVPYGTAKKSSFTGAAGVMQSAEIGKLQVSSLSKALEGAVPGLQAMSLSGQPGENATLRLRGVGSLSAGNEPLIVLDGIPFDGNLNSINPQDVENISVLKDAASASLYGSRAANGVLMITTKKGSIGKTNVSLDIKQGLSKRGVAQYDIMTDPGMYLETYWRSLYNGSKVSNPSQWASENVISNLGDYNPYMNVDSKDVIGHDGKLMPGLTRRYSDSYEDELMRTGYRQEYNIGISGGTEKLTSYFSLGYLNDQGIIKGTDYQRFSARTNLTYNLNKHITTGGNIAYSRTMQNTIKSPEDPGAYSNAFAFSAQVAPVYPVYLYDMAGNKVMDANGKPRFDYGDGNMIGTSSRAYGSLQNPVAASIDDKRYVADDNFMGRGFVDVKFLDHFKFTANLGYDVRNNFLDIFYNNLYGDAQNMGRVRKELKRYETMTANQLLNYSRVFDKVHNLSILAGHESYQYRIKRIYGQKTNISIAGIDEFNNAAVINDLDSYTNKKAIESYLSNLTYDYANKYYFSASIRRDGSSVFHKDVRWGNFWSLGGSWRINHEDFMKNIESINNLRLRASYGTQGNDALVDIEGNPIFKAYEDRYVLKENIESPALFELHKGNKELKWESNKILNLGLDLSMFNSRLTFDFDYFFRKTSDLLYSVPLPISQGLTYQSQNIGDMQNSGIEFTIAGDVIRNDDLRLNLAFTGSHYTNKITNLPSDFVKGNKKLSVGGTAYDYYLIEYAGVQAGTGKSQWYYTKDNGERDVTTNSSLAQEKGRVKAGTVIPDFTGGFNIGAYYKNFDLTVMSNFQLGGKIIDSNYASLMQGGSRAGQNFHKDILNAWTKDNTSSDIPALDYTDRNINVISTRFLMDASYFSLRNITLGYTFGNDILKSTGIKSFRAYVAGDNLFLFSKRKGLDPRQGMSSGLQGKDTALGKTEFAYSAIRAMSLGLSLNF